MNWFSSIRAEISSHRVESCRNRDNLDAGGIEAVTLRLTCTLGRDAGSLRRWLAVPSETRRNTRYAKVPISEGWTLRRYKRSKASLFLSRIRNGFTEFKIGLNSRAFQGFRFNSSTLVFFSFEFRRQRVARNDLFLSPRPPPFAGYGAVKFSGPEQLPRVLCGIQLRSR